MLRRRIAAAAVAAAALFAPLTMLVSSGTPASADTNQCAVSVHTHNGVQGAYCGSQELVSLGLELSVTNKPVAFSQLTVKAAGENKGTDFETFNPVVHADNQKVFEWAPRGVLSGLCAAVSNSGTKLVLKNCNTASATQQFVANGPDAAGGFEWTSESNGLAITAPGGAFSRVIMATDNATSHQSFTFEQ